MDERDAFGATPVMCARDITAMLLLRAGASCEGLPMWRRVLLFRHACAVGDLLNVRTLLQNSCILLALCRNWSKKPFYTMPIMKVTHLLLGLFSIVGAVLVLWQGKLKKDFYAVPVKKVMWNLLKLSLMPAAM